MRKGKTQIAIIAASLVAVFALGFTAGAHRQTLTRDHRLRMARVMPFTSDDGVQHPQSMWALNFEAASIGDKALRVEYTGYHSTDAYDAGASPIAGATHSISINGPDFDAFVQANPQLVGTILTMGWAVADAEKLGPAPAQGQPDTRTSFFSGATPAP